MCTYSDTVSTGQVLHSIVEPFGASEPKTRVKNLLSVHRGAAQTCETYFCDKVMALAVS